MSDAAILGLVGGVVAGTVAVIIGLLYDCRHTEREIPIVPRSPYRDIDQEFRLDASALDESTPDVTGGVVTDTRPRPRSGSEGQAGQKDGAKVE